ncbi:MAG: hypothetical protein HUU01_03925 [Saprospiraceae bacterium]|nr:hypothetical protein [Saprospiraceae bacterium]
MKKRLLFIALTLCAFAAEAQKEQLCKVREQNSKRKPIANAQVIFEDAPAAISQSDGTVRLLFQTLKAGEWTFKVDINRAGYELVNEKEVEKVKLSADGQFGVDIILARAGVVDSVKAIYYGVSNKSLKAGFEREKTKLRKERDAARLSAEQHAERLEQLNTEYENQKKNLDDLSEKFARVNFDDVDSVYQQALERFKAGEVKKAIDILEAIDPAKRTEAIIKKGVFLDSLYAIYQKEKRQQIANLRLLADMYSATFDPAKAESQYDQLLRLDSTDLEILWDAAEFYQNNHRYDKALRSYPLVIAHPKAEDWQVANAYGFIGEMHITTGNLPAALDAYTKLFERYEKLYRSDPKRSFYKSNLAISYSTLGSVHTALGNLPKALTFFEEYNRIEKELHEAYPQNVSFKNCLAISYSTLGSTHTSLGNLPKALIFFEKYIELSKELHEAYPQNVSFKNCLAISYAKLGETHTSLGNLPKALTSFEKCNGLEKELHEAYPQNVSFKNGLAISYSQLACYYRDKMNDLAKAQPYFQLCHDIWKAVSNQFPDYQEFKNNFEWAKNAISVLGQAADPVYQLNQRIQNEPDILAQYQLYTDLCDTLRRRAAQDPAQKTALANALNSRAWTGFFLKKFAAVEADLREGLALGTENKYLPSNLAPALLLQGKQKEAMQEYKKWKDKPFGEQGYATYREAFLGDLNTFEKAGIIPPEVMPGVQEVRKLLEE